MVGVFHTLKELEQSNKTILITANCSVRYSGRAEAILAEGDRLIIIKSDKTILIHQPFGNTPVNYMKEGTEWHAHKEGDEIVIKAQAEKEFLDIRLHKIYDLKSWTLEDGKKLELVGTERDMSDMIFSNPELVEKGLKPVSVEEQTEYGFIDVLCHDKDGNLVVIECKRYVADLKAVSQLRRYVEKVKKSKGIDNVRGVLCAPRISPNAERMLADWGFAFRSVRPPNHLEEYSRNQTSLGDFEEL